MAELTGVADEESGQGQPNPVEGSAIASAPTSSTTGNLGTLQGSGSSRAEATAPNGPNASVASSVSTVPGKRLKNPLGNFSSYNYQISLYMITPDAYEAFIASGRKRINALSEASGISDSGGAFVVAQSGGINNSTQLRAPGFELDYAIDNLSFKTLTSGKSSMTASNNTSFKFNITEPYGFSFITKLKLASDSLAEYAKQSGNGWPQNPIRQFFILGIKFFGYDESGNLLDGSEVFDGATLDPNTNGNGLFETFYDIVFTSVKFKLDGKSTVYQIEAASLPPQSAFSVKRGMINSNKQITATTVGEAIDELFTKINTEQQTLFDNGAISHKNNYGIRYVGDAGEIANASIVLSTDVQKNNWAGSGAETTEQSTVATEIKSVPENTKKTLSFNNKTPILQAINDLIAQSTYLSDALQVVYSTSIEPDPDTGAVPEEKPNTKKTIKWFNCGAEISNARWDSKVSDWAYDITYVIQTYETPILDSAYVNPGTKYYGPHKRYEYYFTGKNSEILSYNQSFDNTYFNVALDPSVSSLTNQTGGTNPGSSTLQAGSGNDASGETNIPQVPNTRSNEPRLGKLGIGLEAQNSYLTSLYDPGAYAKATISILGDPDFLLQDSPSSENQLYDRFYGTNGFTVNPNGGQVFIEIDFNEAVDYKEDTGTLNINESILFWKYPENISKIVKGVSYRVRDVTSIFSNGKFTQTITCDINDFGDVNTLQNDQGRENTTGQTNETVNFPSAQVRQEQIDITPDPSDDDSGGG